MTLYCPHCSTGYLLPDHLIGPGGARVRCPRCQGSFHVAAPGRAPVAAGGLISVAGVPDAPRHGALRAAPAGAPARAVAAPPASANGTASHATADTVARNGSGVRAGGVPAGEAAHDPATRPDHVAGDDTPAWAATATATAPDPNAAALAVVERLLARHGEAITRARAEGRLFREHGPALVDAFDEYQREAGPGAPAAWFRAALHVRLGIALEPAGAAPPMAPIA